VVPRGLSTIDAPTHPSEVAVSAPPNPRHTSGQRGQVVIPLAIPLGPTRPHRSAQAGQPCRPESCKDRTGQYPSDGSRLSCNHARLGPDAAANAISPEVLPQQQVDQHRQHLRGDDREQHHEEAAYPATERADLHVPKAHAARVTTDTNRKPLRRPRPVDRASDRNIWRPCPTSAHQPRLPCLIIRLIIHTILLDPSRAVWTDEASNVSSLDPSGSDQIDAEHQATDLAVGVRIPRGAFAGGETRPKAHCKST
jgi:hypothetical protein